MQLRPYLSVPLSNHHVFYFLGGTAFVRQAESPADLHEHIGILRRGERGMREQTWQEIELWASIVSEWASVL